MSTRSVKHSHSHWVREVLTVTVKVLVALLTSSQKARRKGTGELGYLGEVGICGRHIGRADGIEDSGPCQYFDELRG